MADGTVVIKTDLDNKQAQTKLNDLKTQIARLGKEQAKAEKDIAAAEQNRAKINNELIAQQQKLIELQERATREEQSLNALVEQRDSAQMRRDAARRETEIARQTWAREAQRAGDNYATDVGAQQAAARLNAMREQERAISAEYDKINQKMWEQSGALDRINQDLQQQTAIVNNLGQELTQADNAVQNSKDAYSGITQRLEQAQADAGRYTQQIATTNETIEKTKQKLNEVGDTGEKAARRVSKGFGGIGEGVKRLGHRIVGLAKRVFVFSMITMALRNVRKWLMNVVNSNDEASQSLARLKGSFLTLAQPLLNSLVPALTKVLNVINRIVGAIASFIAAIFGTTVEQAQASAEAMNNEEDAISGVGGAAKKASKQLANFDEINKLGEDSAGGGGGGGAGKAVDFELPEYGGILGKIKGFLDETGLGDALSVLSTSLGKLKKGLTDFFASDAWATIKGLLKDTAITAIRALADVISAIAAVLSGDLYGAIDSLQKLDYDLVFGTLVTLGRLLDKIGITKNAEDKAQELKEYVEGEPKASDVISAIKNQDLYSLMKKYAMNDGFTEEEFDKAYDEWARHWDDVFTGKAFSDAIDGAGQKIADKFAEIRDSEAMQALKQAWADIWSGQALDEWLYATGEKIYTKWSEIKTWWATVKSRIVDAWWLLKSWWHQNITPVIDKIFQPFKDAWEAIKTFYEDNIKTPIEEAGQAVGEAFSNGLEKGLEAIKGVINGIIGAIETALNWIINKINSISFDVPQGRIFGDLAGQHVGFNLQPISIPRLAAGAVIPPNREFLAVLGDQKSGTNIEAPLETIVEAVRQALGGGRTVVLELDRRELGRAVVDVYGQETRRTGLRLGGAY